MEQRKQSGWARAIRGGVETAVLVTVVQYIFGVRDLVILAISALVLSAAFAALYRYARIHEGAIAPKVSIGFGVAAIVLYGFVLVASPPVGMEWVAWLIIVAIPVWLITRGIADMRSGGATRRNGS